MWLEHRTLLAFLAAISIASMTAAQTKEEPSPELKAAREAFIKARRDHADATATLSRAEVMRLRLEKSVRVEFQTKPDLLEARRYAAETARHHSDLRDEVRQELQNDPEYRALQAGVRDGEEALRRAKEDESTTLAQTLSLMHTLMGRRADLTRFEAAAFALDPAIEDARKTMNAAHESAIRLERVYRAQANNDPRLTAAENELAHAKRLVVKTRDALTAAGEKLQSAEQRETMRNANRRADTPPIRRQEP